MVFPMLAPVAPPRGSPSIPRAWSWKTLACSIHWKERPFFKVTVRTQRANAPAGLPQCEAGVQVRWGQAWPQQCQVGSSGKVLARETVRRPWLHSGPSRCKTWRKSLGGFWGPRGSHSGDGTATAARAQGHANTVLTDTRVSPATTFRGGGAEDGWFVCGNLKSELESGAPRFLQRCSRPPSTDVTSQNFPAKTPLNRG